MPQTVKLTRAGCCTLFGWSADGRVYYYDKPDGGQAGTYIVEAAPNPTPRLLTAQWGSFTPDLSLVAAFGRANGGSFGFGVPVTISKVGGGTIATLPDAGALFAFSPDKKRFVYARRDDQQDGPERPQLFTLWVGDVATQPKAGQLGKFREVADLQWLPDGGRIIFAGRDQTSARFGIWTMNTAATVATLAVETKGVRSLRLSPDGKQIAYSVALEADTSGVWIAKTDGSARAKTPITGSFAWSPDNLSLLYTQAGQSGFSLWRYNIADAKTSRLTDPATTSVAALTDWQLAPDGKAIAFRDKDGTLNVLRFAA